MTPTVITNGEYFVFVLDVVSLGKSIRSRIGRELTLIARSSRERTYPCRLPVPLNKQINDDMVGGVRRLNSHHYDLTCTESDNPSTKRTTVTSEDWFNLFARNKARGTLQFIQYCPSKAIWKNCLKEGTALVALVEQQSGSSLNYATSMIERRCISESVPFLRIPQQDVESLYGGMKGPAIIALVITELHNDDVEAINQIKASMTDDYNSREQWRCRLLTSGITARTKIIDAVANLRSKHQSLKVTNPFHFDLIRIREFVESGLARMVFLSQRTIRKDLTNEVIDILKACYEKHIPHVWCSRKHMSSLFGPSGTLVKLVCVTNEPPECLPLIQTLDEVVLDAMKASSHYKPQKDENHCTIQDELERATGGKSSYDTAQAGDNADSSGTQVLNDRDVIAIPSPSVANEGSCDGVETNAETDNHKIILSAATNVKSSVSNESENGIAELTGNKQSEVCIDLESIFLEEKIRLMEIELRTLTSRKNELQSERDRALKNVEINQRKLSLLESQRGVLLNTLERQLQLVEDLRRPLEKVEHTVQRLMSPEVRFSLEDIANLAQNCEVRDLQTKDSEASASLNVYPNGVLQALSEFSEWPVDETRLRQFWFARGKTVHRVGNFIPFLHSEECILAAMRIISIEVLSADSDYNGWRFRRECMWNTCLDVRLFANERTDHDDDNSPSSERLNKKPKIDLSTIDPDIALCPYELAGACLDEFCPHQHLLERSMGRLLPRELIPLPVLTLKNSSQEIVSSSVSSTVADSRYNNTAYGIDKNESENSQAIENNDDFIGLPYVDLSVIGTSAAAADTVDQELSDLPILSEQSINCTQIFAAYHMEFNQSSMAVSFLGLAPESREDKIYFLCRVIRCISLAVHAGRFDISKAIVNKIRQRQVQDDFFPSPQAVMSSIVTIMEDLESKCFAPDAHADKCSIFELYKLQETGALLCFVLQVKESGNSTDTVDDDSFYTFLSLISSEELEGDGGAALTETELTALIKSQLVLSCEGISSTEDFRSLRYILAQVSRIVTLGRAVRKMIVNLPATSVIVLIDNIVSAYLHHFEETINFRQPSQMLRIFTLMGVVTISQTILASLEHVAKIKPDDAGMDSMKSELSELYAAIDRNLLSLSKITKLFPSLNLMLSPVFAGNIALGATLRMYGKVQQRLVQLLLHTGTSSCFRLHDLSDLLWSQLAQLTAVLPKRLTSTLLQSFDGQLSSSCDIIQTHSLIAREVIKREIHLRHVSLPHDWNLVDALNHDKQLLPSMMNLLKIVLGMSHNSTDFELRDRELSFRITRGKSACIGSTIPYSLLWAGTRLRGLTLSRVGLRKLPTYFASYFPIVEVGCLRSFLPIFLNCSFAHPMESALTSVRMNSKICHHRCSI